MFVRSNRIGRFYVVATFVAALTAPVAQGQDLTHWSPQRELRDRATKGRPALALGNGVLCMAWQGLDQNNIWVSVSKDGLNWSPQEELNDRATSSSPALGAAGGLAVMCWKGLDQSNIWV